MLWRTHRETTRDDYCDAIQKAFDDALERVRLVVESMGEIGPVSKE